MHNANVTTPPCRGVRLGKAELELHHSWHTLQYRIEAILFCKPYFLLPFADIRGSVHLAMWVSAGWWVSKVCISSLKDVDIRSR